MANDADHAGSLPRDGRFAPDIEEYGMIGDCLTGALVSRTGSIDWLCLPRFDSNACFASLLGEERHGRWLLAPVDAGPTVTRAYRGQTMILETLFETGGGCVRVTDFMPVGQDASSIIRRIEGVSGHVTMATHFLPRFDFGSATPQVTALDGGAGWCASVGPDLLVLRGPASLQVHDRSVRGSIEVAEGDCIDLVLTWGLSHLPVPGVLDPGALLGETEAFWTEWAGRCTYEGEWKHLVIRSLLTLKAMTYRPTGGLVAAPTAALPEQLGGQLNWDYRYCWLRDATLTLSVFLQCGYEEEGRSFHYWLQRAVAGIPEELRIMYGIAGERRLTEWSASWLPGYQGAGPVPIGNAAADQLQLDVYGDVMSVIHIARQHGLTEADDGWNQHAQFIDHLIKIWEQPDAGIWEVRGEPRNFTHSKMMAWVALDRAIRCCGAGNDPAMPPARWREARDRIHADICAKAFDPVRNSFTQSYGSEELDASLLLMSRLDFLPPDDSRVVGTVQAIERDLLVDGLLLRYRPSALDMREGAFLTCSFWLVDACVLQGRQADARTLFERLSACANDLGLLAEEYDTGAARQVGNFPQALSHLSLVSSALLLRESGI